LTGKYLHVIFPQTKNSNYRISTNILDYGILYLLEERRKISGKTTLSFFPSLAWPFLKKGGDGEVKRG